LYPSELRGGEERTPYPPVQFVANGGSAPHKFSLVGGALPPGLQVSPTGLLNGVPTKAGAFGFSVQAQDANQYKGSRAYSVTILEKKKEICIPPMILRGDVCIRPPTISISPAELPGGGYDQAYAPRQLIANGGARPYTFTLLEGKLPPGLTLTTAGLIAGVPAESGAFNFVVHVTDALDYTSKRAYSITIKEPELAPQPCPSGQVRFGANCVDDGTKKDPPRLPPVVKKDPRPKPCARNHYRNEEGRCVRETDPEPRPCARGKVRDRRGKCAWKQCGRNKYRNERGKCVWEDCPRNKYRNRRGKCVWKDCGRGKYRDNKGKCVREACPRNQYRNRSGRCVWKDCRRGQYRDNRGRCRNEECGRGQYRDNRGRCRKKKPKFNACDAAALICAFKKNRVWNKATCSCVRPGGGGGRCPRGQYRAENGRCYEG